MASLIFSTSKSTSSQKSRNLLQSLLLVSIRRFPFSSSSSPDAPIESSPPLGHATHASLEPTLGADDLPPPLDTPTRPMRGERSRLGPDKMDDLICSMMAKRPWTTRLQNSIRELCPSFDRGLVLDVLRGARSPDHALQFFRWVEKTGFHHDRETYLEITRILTQASMLNHARCLLLDDMPKRGIAYEEDMFIPLIEAYGRAGIPQEVVKIFRKIPALGVERTVRSYNVFFKAILRHGRGMMAKRVFNAMLRDGVDPTLYTYNIMIWGFCLSEMMQTATRFFEEMKGRGVEPDVVTYNTLLSGWVRRKGMEEAEGLFMEMGERGLLPNAITYNTLIKGYVSIGKPGNGLQLFSEMEKNGVQPSEKTYSVLLPGLCEDPKKALEATKLLGVMAERHFRPNDDSIFERLISCLSSSDLLDKAVEALRLIDKFRLVADSTHYGVLVESFCKAGKHDRAVKLLDEMLERQTLSIPNSHALEPSAYNPVIEYMCKNGLSKKAEALFRQLMKKGVDDSITFNHLIRGHAVEGEPESAVELLAIMKRRGISSDEDAHILLVESFLKKGEPADAKTALDVMIEQGHSPSSSLFLSVMESLFNDGRVQTASRVMKIMIEKGLKENMDMVQKILETLLIRGHVEEAIGRINLIMVSRCSIDLDSLFIAICDKGKTIAALKLADFALERDCHVSMSSYDRVLEALHNTGKTLNAYSLLCKIQKKHMLTNMKAAANLLKSLNEEANTKQADILSRLIFSDSHEKRPMKTMTNAI